MGKQINIWCPYCKTTHDYSNHVGDDGNFDGEMFCPSCNKLFDAEIKDREVIEIRTSPLANLPKYMNEHQD